MEVKAEFPQADQQKGQPGPHDKQRGVVEAKHGEIHSSVNVRASRSAELCAPVDARYNLPTPYVGCRQRPSRAASGGCGR
eukprot:scaffold30_cov416-Prasinococcus_capsulatus_cf.AAC.16